MQRTFTISFSLLIASAALAAQAVNQYQPQKFDPQAVQSQTATKMELMRAPEASSCPALFKARQGGMGDFVATGRGNSHDTGISQQIHLSTTGTSNHQNVVSASVTVHGLTPQSRFRLVESGDEWSQASRKLQVGFSRDAAGETAADMALRGFSAVFSIDIDAVTYADGSTWKSAEGVCRIVPDPVMLIGAR